jgi:hypothetical protein
VLRELARDSNSGVRTEALEALASFSRPEALSVLCDRALASDHKVAVDAIRGLATRCSREELEAFLNRHDQKLCAGALAALDERLYMPEWLKPKDSA